MFLFSLQDSPRWQNPPRKRPAAGRSNSSLLADVASQAANLECGYVSPRFEGTRFSIRSCIPFSPAGSSKTQEQTRIEGSREVFFSDGRCGQRPKISRISWIHQSPPSPNSGREEWWDRGPERVITQRGWSDSQKECGRAPRLHEVKEDDHLAIPDVSRQPSTAHFCWSFFARFLKGFRIAVLGLEFAITVRIWHVVPAPRQGKTWSLKHSTSPAWRPGQVGLPWATLGISKDPKGTLISLGQRPLKWHSHSVQVTRSQDILGWRKLARAWAYGALHVSLDEPFQDGDEVDPRLASVVQDSLAGSAWANIRHARW